MLLNAKTRISLVRKFKLSKLKILKRSDKYFITFFYFLFFNIYVVLSQLIRTFETFKKRYITITLREQRYLQNCKFRFFTRRYSKTSKRSINLL